MFPSRTSLFLILLLAYIDIPLVRGRAEFRYDAASGVRTLQNWYNQDTGLYDTGGWWISANCITTLADLSAIDPVISDVSTELWKNTLDRAQKFNQKQKRSSNRRAAEERDQFFIPDSVGSSRKRNSYLATSYQAENLNPKGFLNGFFDDEGWWALAWMTVYDHTRSPEFLQASVDIFEDLVSSAANATCGGVWWDRKKAANTAISNELFLSTAAHLAFRVPDRRDYYTSWAVKQWEWFDRSGLINSDHNINDGLDLTTCKNNGADVWSYNQGVILGALVELNKVHPNATYIERATDIANAALKTMTDENGILHDPREPNLGGDGYMFKGVFVRNLGKLYQVTKNDKYKVFLERNAETVWNKARNETSGVFTGTWTGPFEDQYSNTGSHCSGFDAIVAAVGVQ